MREWKKIFSMLFFNLQSIKKHLLTVMFFILFASCKNDELTKVEFYALPRYISVLTSSTRTLENYGFSKDTVFVNSQEKYYYCKTSKQKLAFYIYGTKEVNLSPEFIQNNTYKLNTDTSYYGPKLCFVFKFKEKPDTIYINSSKKVYYEGRVLRMNDTLFNYLTGFLPVELKENWQEDDLHIEFQGNTELTKE